MSPRCRLLSRWTLAVALLAAVTAGAQDFDGGLGLGYLYPNDDNQRALSDSMSSYWAEFAWSGNPGRGRDGKQPQWLSWGTENKTMLILDTPSDQGIRMTGDEVSAATIKAALVADREIASNEERCRLYAVTFSRGQHFDAAEFASFGEHGCAEFDPEALRQF